MQSNYDQALAAGRRLLSGKAKELHARRYERLVKTLTLVEIYDLAQQLYDEFPRMQASINEFLEGQDADLKINEGRENV